jgi:anti-anti-sigma factor
MTEIIIDESVDISRVGLLYDKLGSLLKQSSPVALNLANISHIDCAGVQLIYAFIQTGRNQGLEIHLNQASDAFRAAVNTLGLSEYFALAE